MLEKFKKKWTHLYNIPALIFFHLFFLWREGNITSKFNLISRMQYLNNPWTNLIFRLIQSGYIYKVAHGLLPYKRRSQGGLCVLWHSLDQCMPFYKALDTFTFVWLIFIWTCPHLAWLTWVFTGASYLTNIWHVILPRCALWFLL